MATLTLIEAVEMKLHEGRDLCIRPNDELVAEARMWVAQQLGDEANLRLTEERAVQLYLDMEV